MKEFSKKPNSIDLSLEDMLIHFINSGSIEKVIDLIRDNASIVNSQKKSTKETPLHYAAESNNIDMVKLLLSLGAKESVKVKSNSNLFTPLHHAVMLGNTEMVQLFLDLKIIDITQVFEWERTLLHLAVGSGSVEMVRLFLNISPVEFLHRSFSIAGTPLMFSVMKNNIDITRLLLEYGAALRINEVNCEGETPLDLSIRNNNIDMTRLLLEHGATIKINKIIKGGETTLSIAVKNNNINMARLLLSYATDISINNILLDGETLLHKAFRLKESQAVHMVNLLLDHGALYSLCLPAIGATPLDAFIDSYNERLEKDFPYQPNAGSLTNMLNNIFDKIFDFIDHRDLGEARTTRAHIRNFTIRDTTFETRQDAFRALIRKNLETFQTQVTMTEDRWSDPRRAWLGSVFRGGTRREIALLGAGAAAGVVNGGAPRAIGSEVGRALAAPAAERAAGERVLSTDGELGKARS
jgi:ankyrin repeat protein